MRTFVALFVLLVALLGAAAALHTGRIVVPAQWNPWAPLHIEHPLNWLTRLKLERLESDAELCATVLAQAPMRYRAVEDRTTGPGCGFENAIRIERTSVAVGTPFLLSCRTAVALALWERHVLHPAALTHFSERVARVDHLGSYACRDVYGRSDARRSRHATADAVDIAGFVLESGRRITVLRDWEGEPQTASFLREAHGGACRVFDAVLGPAYNEAHRDHFHLDRGGPRVCR
jgi:hypothetical protein